MSWGIVAGAAVGLVGSAVSAKGAKKAAQTQADAAAAATAAQERMFERQVELQEPWRDTGEAGLNKLSYLLGIGNPADDNNASAKAAKKAEPDEVTKAYREFLGRDPEPGGYAYYKGLVDSGQWSVEQMRADIAGSFEASQPHGQYVPTAEEVAAQQGPTSAQAGPDYGALLRKFSLSDFEKDPGYEFRLNEGRKALEGGAASRGGLFSGAAGKALTRYGQDYGSGEFGKAFDRYNVNQTNTFNRLATVAGLGQTAANQTGAAAQNFGNQAGSNMIGAGNATAAGQVGASNAWSNAIGQGWNNYQNNELMKKLQAPSGGYRYQVPTYEGAEY